MAGKKRRLGKGLDALIPTSEDDETPEAETGVREVPVGSVLPNPRQPRSQMSEEALDELAASIDAHGLIQPLIVTQIEDGAVGERFQLIAGERRWRAAKRAGLEHVPVLVKEASEQQMLEWALIENVQRADLNPIEEAQAYQQLADEFGLTHSEIAQRVGKSRTAVTNMLRLLKLPQPIQDMVLDGTLTEGHARALLPLEMLSVMLDAVDRIRDKGLNVRQTEALVRRQLRSREEESRSIEAKTTRDASQDEYLEHRFEAVLGTKVKLKRTKNGGRVVIHFFNEEDLQRVYDIIVGE